MIKCSKCGAELSDDIKFCLYCGNRIDAATTPPTENQSVPFGTFHTKAAKAKDKKSKGFQSLADKIKDKAIEEWNKLSLYGKILTVLALVFTLLLLVALLANKMIAAIVATIQIILVVISLLIRKGIIRMASKQLWIQYLVLAIAILLTAIYSISYASQTKEKTTDADRDWSQLPTASAPYNENSTLSSDTLVEESISNSIVEENENQNSTVSLSDNESTTSNDTNRIEKNGFDSSSNELYNLAAYSIEIPVYWQHENIMDSGIQRYAEIDGKAAMIQISAVEETDTSYPVTFDGLMDDNENMIEMIKATTFNKVTGCEIIDTGVIKGILYKGTIELENIGISGYGEWFIFPSEVDRNWCTLILCQSENTDYSYIDDFMKMIQSIKPIEKTNDTAKDHTEASIESIIEDSSNSEQNLTAENSADLAALLSLNDPGDPSVSVFASKYSGQIIEFDGCVNSIQNHGDYTTRWDVLLGAGNFNKNRALGPNFHLTNVNFYDMNVSGGDSVYAGLNVHVVAKVGKYNPNSELFELDIISMDIRD